MRTTPLRKLRILIAEDSEVVRRGLRSLLEDQPEWNIIGEPATSSEAIEKTKTLRPDLLLLDVTMPDVEPEKAIPQIINACPTVKIIALVTKDSSESAANALVAGAKGLVLKSDAASEVVRTVQHVGDNLPFLSPAAVTLIANQLAKHQTAGPIPADLTTRELEVLVALARGASNKEAAAMLGISIKTVNSHRNNIMQKLKLRNYRSLVHFAIREGLLKGA
jgi:two-component system response regulator NreC